MFKFRPYQIVPLFAALALFVGKTHAQTPEPAPKATTPSLKLAAAPNSAPERAKAIFKAAFELFQGGQFEAAELQFKKGLAVDPNSAIAHYYLAEIQTRLRKPDEAMQHYEAVVKLAPDSKEAALVAVIQREAERRPGKVFKDCPDCPDMVIIPTGRFEMGSTNPHHMAEPVHSVSIKTFALGKTEVTQGQWRAVMGSNPSKFNSCGDDCPVEQVSWDDAQVFLKKLSDQTGKQYRLPSESEWEYACRASGQHENCGSDSVDSIAWYVENSGKSTHPVGHKQPNVFGLYDMSGNVWEWVEDGFPAYYSSAPTDGSAWQGGDDKQRRVRGGAWGGYLPADVSAAGRGSFPREMRSRHTGFRVARML